MLVSKLINLKRLSIESGIEYFSLMRRLHGQARTRLSVKERTAISNALLEAVKPLFKEIGFSIEVKRLPELDVEKTVR